MHNLTGFKRDCLTVIAGMEEPKGLDVKDKLDEYYETEINHGRLYPNLNDLADEGLIEIGSIDDRTNSYSLTDEGREVLQSHREWENDYLN
jgi:PadR family transcriptional regulator PadR